MKQRSLVFALLATISVLALAACGGSAATKPLTAADIIKNAQNSNLKDTTFDAAFAITTSGIALNFTGTGKATQSPNRSEIVYTVSILGQSITSDTITDGNDTYTKTTPGTTTEWVKTTGSSGSSLGVNSSDLTDFSQLSNATLVGTETVNGYQAYHLKGTVPDSTPTPGPTPSATSTPSTSSTTEDLWIRTGNYYPLKVLVTLADSSASSGSATTGTVTFTFKTWNTGISIALPPANDVTNG